MANEPQEKPANNALDIILKDIYVTVPVTTLQLPNIDVAPHSQFWTPESQAAMNASLAAERQAFNEMIAREIPSAVAPPPLSDAEKAMKKMFDEIASHPQFDPSTFLRK